ncbi:MAG: ATP-binding protein [Coprococcus sp.]
MKKSVVILIVLVLIILSFPLALLCKSGNKNISKLDVVEVNALISEIEATWNSKEYDYPKCSFEYVVLDKEENLLYKSDASAGAVSVVKATENRDTIRVIMIDSEIAGWLIIYNNAEAIETVVQKKYISYFLIAVIFSFIIILGYIIWLNNRVVKPFGRMKQFADSVAAGELDKPLVMDKENIFGAFTESFDIMREELARAREREYKANVSKREMIAQLSHDIKTPVASIKAMAELLTAKSENEAGKTKLMAISAKADQIDGLVSNLFASTMEELEKLEVNVAEMESTVISDLIREADYNGYITDIDIPGCIILCDRLRTVQVINNIIYNSYKYADTDIFVDSLIDEDYLEVAFTDRGGGVPVEELSIITEKYKRGKNSEGKQGAGLGLYISKELMENMQGSIDITNADGGLRVVISFKLA